MDALKLAAENSKAEGPQSVRTVSGADTDQGMVRRSAVGAMTYLVLGLAVLLAATQLQKYAPSTRIIGIIMMIAASARLGFGYSILLQSRYKRDWRWRSF